ncbi:hypothetical protein TcWFU_008182 [Taenia crassiceps]|uniref:Uncharacterized protein n=1 Tax=Taenia crassiceps TaxID=6207 RepID=A0ABR4QSJ5_9CEST
MKLVSGLAGPVKAFWMTPSANCITSLWEKLGSSIKPTEEQTKTTASIPIPLATLVSTMCKGLKTLATVKLIGTYNRNKLNLHAF